MQNNRWFSWKYVLIVDKSVSNSPKSVQKYFAQQIRLYVENYQYNVVKNT